MENGFRNHHGLDFGHAYVCVYRTTVISFEEMVNFISVLMMLILTLGHMVPLVLNFEAIFSSARNQQNVPFQSNGWLEVDVLVRIVTMVTFLLQFRLLRLTWIAKKRTVGFMKCGHLSSVYQFILSVGQHVARLSIDGFLFPQLILNIFQISKGIALSHWFYIGTTFVRLLPHAYDLLLTLLGYCHSVCSDPFLAAIFWWSVYVSKEIPGAC
ncbi:hypothetical protein L1987_55595 [Smallanthus sonchifolius]|uniref:Uncharacterized protein n=1 Tax=Smallanthus sonchifolius TaxID=185202 RepID=A0ACB9EA12_9ASTR|nr:hypothetical protein L1987_55595 [Smallanthus sonchifolius]